MPLIKGKSDKSRSKNIAELIKAGHSRAQSAAIAYKTQRKAESKDDYTDEIEYMMDEEKTTAREYDVNNFMEVPGTPISKVGVFPYTGAQIGLAGLDPDAIYQVYRSEDELSDPETIKSFKLLPLTDEHEMLGSYADNLTPAEKKGVHGITGEDVFFEDPYLKANIKVFSEKLKNLIDGGKKELSIGYRCIYEPNRGRYNGDSYEFIQTNIRGNHLALVEEGRSGHDVAVLDHFKFVFDSKDLKMPDFALKDKEEVGKGDIMKPEDEMEEGMSMKECREMLGKIAMRLEKMEMQGDDFEDKEESDRINMSENDIYDEDMDKEKMMDEMDPDEKKEMSEKAAREGDMKDKRGRDKKENEEDEDMSKSVKTGRKEGAMDAQIKSLQRQVHILKSNGTKALLKEISQRDYLANKLSQHIGTFDHASKTLDEVVKYGVKKLGLKSIPGHEQSVLSGYLAAAKTRTPSIHAQDSIHKSSQIDSYLNEVK